MTGCLYDLGMVSILLLTTTTTNHTVVDTRDSGNGTVAGVGYAETLGTLRR